MSAAPRSTLGYALLGLLHAAPQSGYDLRKTFVVTPLAAFSDSPGAIYPALRRLVRQRWIAPVSGGRRGRRRTPFAPTPSGRQAFREWLRRPPTRDDVVRGWDVLMLRLAFMDAVPRAELRRFLQAMRAELRGYVAELEAFAADHARQMPFAAQLAFGSGVEGSRAQLGWIESAIGRARKKGRT
jgi:DNA-binding PadR family transcriptional regulator